MSDKHKGTHLRPISGVIETGDGIPFEVDADDDITERLPLRPEQRSYGTPIEHPRPWWFRLALRLCPGRCREIPEAANPDRIVLRQVALIGRHVYLQQFASGEDPRFMHSHPYRFMIAVGLWGSYIERRIAGRTRTRRAPYLYTMDGGHVHHVQAPTAGHTSIFVGIGREADGSEGDKHYYGVPRDAVGVGYPPTSLRLNWADHIQVKVERI